MSPPLLTTSSSTRTPFDKPLQSSSTPKDESQRQHSGSRIYFDISVADRPVGRLVFHIPPRSSLNLPLHTENILALCRGDQRSVHPRCTYLQSRFRHSPQFIEGMPQYRWVHTLDTAATSHRVVNAVGRFDERLSADPTRLRSCTHKVYGGLYYGVNYDEVEEKCGVEGVVLTVPLVGSDRGSAGFSIVRVGESPMEWRERLLDNSAVVGYLEGGEGAGEGDGDGGLDSGVDRGYSSSGIDVLRAMARQTRAPPMIVGCGIL